MSKSTIMDGTRIGQFGYKVIKKSARRISIWMEGVPKLGITTSQSDCISQKEGDRFMFPFLNLNDIAKIDALSCSIWKCLVMLCGTTT